MDPTQISITRELALNRFVETLSTIEPPLAEKVMAIFQNANLGKPLPSDLIGSVYALYVNGLQEIRKVRTNYKTELLYLKRKIEGIRITLAEAIESANKQLGEAKIKVVQAVEKTDAAFASAMGNLLQLSAPEIPVGQTIPKEFDISLTSSIEPFDDKIRGYEHAWKWLWIDLGVEQISVGAKDTTIIMPRISFAEQSPQFAQMLSDIKNKGLNEIELNVLDDFRDQIVKAFILCLQTGKSDDVLTISYALDLLAIAYKYEMEWLIKDCVAFIDKSLCDKWFIFASLELAFKLHLSDLCQICFRKIYESLRYKNFDKDQELVLSFLAQYHALTDLAMIMDAKHLKGRSLTFTRQNELHYDLTHCSKESLMGMVKDILQIFNLKKKPYNKDEGIFTMCFTSMGSYVTNVRHPLLECDTVWYTPSVQIRMPFNSEIFWHFAPYYTKEQFAQLFASEKKDIIFRTSDSVPQGAAALAAALEESHCSTLDLSSLWKDNPHFMDMNNLKSITALFFEALAFNTTVKRLILPLDPAVFLDYSIAGVNLDEEGQRLVQAAQLLAKQNQTLEEISIVPGKYLFQDYSKAGFRNSASQIDAAWHNKKITVSLLQKERYNDDLADCFWVFADYMTKNNFSSFLQNKLREGFSIKFNEEALMGAPALALALEDNPEVATLKANRFLYETTPNHSRYLKLILVGLRHNKTVAKLKLPVCSGGGFSKAEDISVMRDLRATLRQNQTLSEVVLVLMCDFTKQGAALVLDGLCSNRSLERVSFIVQGIIHDGVEELFLRYSNKLNSVLIEFLKR